jgi:hypothetical protein
VRGRADEAREHGLGDPPQRLLALIGAPELEGGDAEAVAALLGDVDDEALVLEDVEEVVGGGSREVEVSRDGGCGQGLGVAGEEPEDLEGVGGGWGVFGRVWSMRRLRRADRLTPRPGLLTAALRTRLRRACPPREGQSETNGLGCRTITLERSSWHNKGGA